jgi:mercuric ion transport protein
MKRLELTSAGGFAAATVAVVASSCCALPMALVLAGVSTGAVSFLGSLHAVRPIILGMAVVLLAVGWGLAIRRRVARAYPLLAVASTLVVVALTWQAWDPMLQRVIMQAAARP